MLIRKYAKNQIKGGRFRFLPPLIIPLFETTKEGCAHPSLDSPQSKCYLHIEFFLLIFVSCIVIVLFFSRYSKFQTSLLPRKFSFRRGIDCREYFYVFPKSITKYERKFTGRPVTHKAKRDA